MPARVATPRTPAPAPSRLDKLRAIWSRNGKRSQSNQETSPIPIQFPPLSPSPIEYVEKPQRAASAPKPKYPSILERGYQDRINVPPEAPPKLPPIDTHPLFTDPDQSRRKVRIPPRALIVPPLGRPIPGLSDRKKRSPNTPAHRRRSWLSRHHPFLKDPLTPTSAPVFSHHAYARTPTTATNLPPGWVMPRSSVAPEGPRPKGRRIPAPRFEEPRRAPPAPSLPPLPEDRVAPSTADPRMYAILPPGLQSPYRRRQPAPI
ncbi:hypothetical protein BDQ17DRAFT_1348846 [Cyathus striatus]|nr:hypothetical protein BDQ17DRAFT_1348846 [Cyathus striatus]